MNPTDRCRERGQATVEVVLALPVVVLSLLLVIQIGLIAHAQVLVVHAAREGARAAAIEGTAASAVAAARATPGLQPDRLAVHVDLDAEPGGLATVQVSYRVPTEVALVGRLLPGPTLTASVTMRVE